MDKTSILDELNLQQRQAATSDHHRILCLAGAGTGKTKTLVSRIACLYHDGVKPAEMLALTFTRAAGQEMKERIIGLIGEDGKNLFCNTFHAWAVKIIRQYAFQIGYTPTFTIYDEEDRADIIAQIIDELQYDIKAEDVLKAMNKESVRQVPITDSDMRKIVSEYRFRIRKNNAIDLDGLIAGLQKLLDNNAIKELINREYPYIFVDEFQDTDHRQMDLLNAINPQNLFVVGDDFQSIYKFRGADVSIIMDMAENPEYEVIKLEENYRSTMPIVNAANALIKHNNQTEKILKAHRRGPKNEVYHCDDHENEMAMISAIINHLRLPDVREDAGGHFGYMCAPKMSFKDIAILGRTNKQIQAIAEALKEANIPCQIKTNTADVLMSQDAKKLFTWMRAVLNPTDDVTINAALNWPSQTITKKDLLDVEMFQLEKECSLHTALMATGKAEIFFNIFRTIEVQIIEDYDPGEHVSAVDLLKYVIEATAIAKKYADEGRSTREREIREILQAVINWQVAKAELGESYTAEEWLDYYLQRNIEGERLEETQEDAVQIMTAHGSKGLEFPIVIIAGCYQKNFPMTRGSDIEEERRLFYVAMTRAKDRLYMTAPSERISWGGKTEQLEESQFWDEIKE